MVLATAPPAMSQGFRQAYHDADGHLSYFPDNEDRNGSWNVGLLTI
jgi:hypothetical protein